MPAKTFPLADILSITTGRLLSHHHMHGIYDILNHMTGQDLCTHQLPGAARKAKPALLAQHPHLAGVEPPKGLNENDVMAWVAEAERAHGTTAEVQPLTDWEYLDPTDNPWAEATPPPPA